MRNDQQIIIKRIKKGGHGHHGGAWKIAYADFVTAMMAFFLLMWLISMTTPEQKQGLADYFAPPSISPSNSGAGGVMGGTALDSTGAKMAGSSTDDRKSVSVSPDNQTGKEESVIGGRAGKAGSDSEADESSRTDLAQSEDQVFHSAAASIRQAWQAMPDITQIASNLVVEETKDGLNIELLDQEGRPMFPEGSKYPYEVTRKAIAAIAPILEKLPNQISISGHTAAGSRYDNPRYGAWELSSDRANVVRGILSEFGLNEQRIDAVSGRATAEPYFPNDPYLAANERVRITLVYEAPPVPAGMKP
jgi:chemotaxis protein MotB